MSRLPQTSRGSSAGCVYVVRRGDAYKIGFTRGHVPRRVRDAGGSLVLVVHAGARPSVLEYLINRRFEARRLIGPVQPPKAKREWLALTLGDIEWLRGLSRFMDDTLNA